MIREDEIQSGRIRSNDGAAEGPALGKIRFQADQAALGG
jgi:hypothetical protein